MSKVQKMKFGLKVLKGRYAIARGATPGMECITIFIAAHYFSGKSPILKEPVPIVQRIGRVAKPGDLSLILNTHDSLLNTQF